MSATPRQSLSLHLRAFPGWERLRAEVAAALQLPVVQVRGLDEPADPAVRIEANAKVLGFQLALDLYADPRRVAVPAIATLAARLAAQLGLDVAYHDGSSNPYGYVLQRATGERFAAAEQPEGDADGLVLDEAPDQLRALP